MKGSLQQTGVTKAQEFKAETESHDKELKTPAQAKQGIQEATGMVASFLQVG